MRSSRSLTCAAWGLGLALACCLSFGGCSESAPSGPVEQTAEQKAQAEAANKATADAFKDAQKKAKKTATPRRSGNSS